MTTKIVRKTLEEAQGLPNAEIDFSEKNLVLHLFFLKKVGFFVANWCDSSDNSKTSSTWRRCPAYGT